jgi:dihydroxyacid dehydratase/phosphogluconate dehydratase
VTGHTRTPPTAAWPSCNGDVAPDGAVVKTAGVPTECLTFRGRARVVESQEAAVEAILGNRNGPGDVSMATSASDGAYWRVPD